MSHKQVHDLLSELCRTHGICLPPPVIKRMCNCPPPTVDRFTDVVFKAEGLDSILSRDLRRKVLAIVAKHFDAAAKPPA